MTADLFKRFGSAIGRLERIRGRVDSALAAGAIRPRDAETFYESLLLRGSTYLESFFEELFCTILLGRIGYPASRVRAVVPFSSTRQLHRVVWAGKQYLDWLPFEHTKRRAEIYLRRGYPFCELDAGQLSRLKYIHIIRNAIAHSSDHARGEFRRVVLSGHHLTKSEKTPGGYLRAVAIVNPRTTRLALLLNDMLVVADALKP